MITALHRARAVTRYRGHPRDEGSAIVEFLGLAVLLLVPLVYLVVALARLQAASFAVEAAARDGARSVSSAPDPTTGAERAEATALLALSDQGLARPQDPKPEVTVQCSATPCLTPEARVTVQVRVEVVLPGVPVFLDRVIPARMPVQATGTAVVDRYAAVAP